MKAKVLFRFHLTKPMGRKNKKSECLKKEERAIVLHMAVWAIADLHLSFGVANKSMEAFGPTWARYTERIKENWERDVKPEDLVLIAGDISWALRLEEVKVDLEWIHNLPGTKVMIKGNHDYWWHSIGKVRSILPSSIHVVQNDVFNWNDISIGGTRLWDSNEYHFDQFINFQPGRPRPQPKPEDSKVFEREIERLLISLQKLDQKAKHRIVMTHYPPISADLQPSRVSLLLEQYNVDICLFGHLHQVKENSLLFGTTVKTKFYLTSADYLKFQPLKIL